MKNLFTMLLLLCATIATAHDFEVDGIYYNITNTANKTVEVTYRDDYSSEYTGSVVIPESVTYSGVTYRVTSIDYSAFDGCSELTSVEIGNSVTSIGDYAFYECTGLTSIVIPNSVTRIYGYDAFNGCTGLKAVHISDLAAWCGIDFGSTNANPLYYAKNLYLNGEKLTELIIPDGIVEIKNYTFYNCNNLTSVVIPNSVTSIGDYAFQNCTGLTSIIVATGNANYDSRDNCNAIIETATNTLVAGCKNTLIPNSVTSIGNYAFRGCTGLTSIEIPNSVTSIGNSAFEDCTGLTSIKIPNSVTSIGNYAFEDCTGLISVEIPNSVTSIAFGAFSGCAGLTSITIPNSVTSIGDYAFNGCSGLTSVVIPNSVTSIGDWAFGFCTGLTSVVIPNSVTSIGYSAFYGCSDLETLYISNTIESIYDNAFAECNNILEIKIGSMRAITASENVFSSDAYNNACLYVPTGRKEFYAKTSPWSNFTIREMDFTGIDEIAEQRAESKNVYYDLSGRVVENPTNGIYIINGKKVLIK